MPIPDEIVVEGVASSLVEEVILVEEASLLAFAMSLMNGPIHGSDVDCDSIDEVTRVEVIDDIVTHRRWRT
jgi:hypothetical protein